MGWCMITIFQRALEAARARSSHSTCGMSVCSGESLLCEVRKVLESRANTSASGAALASLRTE